MVQRHGLDAKDHLGSGSQGIATCRHRCRSGMVGLPFDVDREPSLSHNTVHDTDHIISALQNGTLFNMQLKEGSKCFI